MTSLIPFRLDVTVGYDAAFLYLNTRGVVAERWGHRELFGRHAITETGLQLSDSPKRHVAVCELKKSAITFAGPQLPPVKDMCETACDYLQDCLKVVQPRHVTSIVINLRAYMESESFELARSTLAAELLSAACAAEPAPGFAFSDLAVTLSHQAPGVVFQTVFGPMRREELAQHLIETENPVDGGYPENLIYVQRVIEAKDPPSAPGRKAQPWREASAALGKLVADYGATCATDTESYVRRILSMPNSG